MKDGILKPKHKIQKFRPVHLVSAIFYKGGSSTIDGESFRKEIRFLHCLTLLFCFVCLLLSLMDVDGLVQLKAEGRKLDVD
ncbi:hypothetical protein BJX62DRAFT_172375 [Aspergillus germanicus]